MTNKYPFNLVPDGNSYSVTFPDIPEAITFGDTAKEASERAHDCLLTALEFYFEDVREVPAPSKVKKGQHAVELPASIAVKVQLLNEMVRQRIKQVELAKRMHLSPTQVNRIVNVRQPTKIDTINEAFKALGKHLDFVVA
ncbi:MAG: type II toxin-antitoxin system HicB family antitoxin [Candidimonas sp.]|nr:MAG: type II toxin-antitoxin system HicB family antitoxin [Candidimonas sp.]TAM26414.1 MAG: type II toxin-antitoxin system HicB family antitoxin [Candidimonas sp.]TAM79354.1 MAG: type II toxin-antitoxin system HicB family antitoxin [Candidimonas sp.]